tara:strand:- start:80 stop:250 length:171 start_codon:yes stop_codon:yes gene_type:complete
MVNPKLLALTLKKAISFSDKETATDDFSSVKSTIQLFIYNTRKFSHRRMYFFQFIK